MGKVGSSSVVATLRAAGIDRPLYHVHCLTARGLARELAEYRQVGLLWSERATHVFTGLGLLARVHLSPPDRWRVITGVRDPIARAVSGLFQTASYRRPELCVDGLPDEDRVLEFLHRRMRRGDELVESTYRWLDRELARSLDVDLYEHRFDRELGYTIVETGDVRLLAYRTEDLAERLPSALGTFLDTGHPVPLVSRNVSTEKDYGDRYERVKRRFRLPEERLAELYDHRYMAHFYGPDGIARIVRRWAGGNGPGIRGDRSP